MLVDLRLRGGELLLASGLFARRLETHRRREARRRTRLVGFREPLERRHVAHELTEQLLVALRRGALFVGFVREDVARLELTGLEPLGDAENVTEAERQLIDAVTDFVKAELDLLGDRDLLLAREQRHAAHLLQVHAHRIGAVGAVVAIGGGDLGDDRNRRLVFVADLLDVGDLGLVDRPVGFVAEESFVAVVGRRRRRSRSTGLFGESFDDLDVVVGKDADRVLEIFGKQVIRRRDAADVFVGDVAALATELDQPADALFDGGARAGRLAHAVGGVLRRGFLRRGLLREAAGRRWGFRGGKDAFASHALLRFSRVRAHRDPLNCMSFVKLRRHVFGVNKFPRRDLRGCVKTTVKPLKRR